MSGNDSGKCKIGVVGGGLGGLAAAIRLAHAGFEVDLFERGGQIGGKMARLERGGFRWDMGPSLLTMPEVVRSLWRDVGADADRHLDILPLDSTCRYRWCHGKVIDENAAFWRISEVAAYLDHARGVYELSAEAFLENAPSDIAYQLRLDRLPSLRHLPKVASPRSLHHLNTRFFKDTHLLQIFDRFATYNGSSPYRTPAVFCIIPYVQAAFGGHYLRGGMFALALAMRALAESQGVRIHTGCDVRRARRDGPGWVLELAGGDAFECGRIVCNMDAITAVSGLFADAVRNGIPPSRDPSTSGFVLFLGMSRQDPALGHHNILFSDDYAREFELLHKYRRPAAQPTIYIAAGSRTDPAMAPPGKDSWFVLVNAPATDPGFSWKAQKERYAETVLDRIGKFGFGNVCEQVETMEIFTPEDFETRDLAWRGALYGFASHGLLSAFRRPPMRRDDLPGVHFTGGTTHPGGGVPLVLLSGKITADHIIGGME